jgi:puromycin-sensitive aminopeptidase
VSPEWWTNLWLNEGFASALGVQATDFCFPNWQLWTDFVSTYLFRALELDAMDSTHEIEVEVRTSGEVNEIFDAISYNKGASVIRVCRCNFVARVASPHRFSRAPHALR